MMEGLNISAMSLPVSVEIKEEGGLGRRGENREVAPKDWLNVAGLMTEDKNQG